MLGMRDERTMHLWFSGVALLSNNPMTYHVLSSILFCWSEWCVTCTILEALFGNIYSWILLHAQVWTSMYSQVTATIAVGFSSSTWQEHKDIWPSGKDVCMSLGVVTHMWRLSLQITGAPSITLRRTLTLSVPRCFPSRRNASVPAISRSALKTKTLLRMISLGKLCSAWMKFQREEWG